MAGVKTVRLRNIHTDVVVETTEEVAAGLPAGWYEPESKTTAKRSAKSDSK